MKRIIILAGIASLAASTAMAADVVYQEPAPIAMDVVSGVSWEGFYAGIQAGYGFGSAGDVSISPFTFGPLITAFTPAGAVPGSSVARGNSFSDGFVGGAHIGYDWQRGNIVFGGVLDVNYTDVDSVESVFSRSPAEYTFARDLNYLATLRARVGYAFADNRWLAYATGGLAYGDFDIDYIQGAASPASFTTSGDTDGFGYTVGGGVETMLTDNLSFGIEYLYTRLNNDFQANLTGGPFGGPGSANPAAGTTLEPSDFDYHTVTAKISYRF
ncbi:outer membrane protein [Aliihoeflea sp. PC F10.4]